ncbi:hypothetical protein WDU99_01580 [Microbacterium sp. Mu-80]|uniref:Uncharacterized protein n=1 Tax=Microbacterium bandirmense TaxID=3122050 RepID=A0ABU8L8N4_9MICO
MAELDYAYLADYAQIEGGKISALGASYTHATVPAFPILWLTSIVGRVRVDEGEDPVSVRIEVLSPGDSVRVNFESVLEQTPDVRPYRGKVGLLFAATLQMPVATNGLCTFDIYLNGEHARRLAFEIELAEAQ